MFPLPSPPPAARNTWLPSCISEACWEAENASRSSRDSRSWRRSSAAAATGAEFYSATCRSPSTRTACPTCRTPASASCCPTTRATMADVEFNGYIFSNAAIENSNQLHLFVQNQADLSFRLQNIKLPSSKSKYLCNMLVNISSSNICDHLESFNWMWRTFVCYILESLRHFWEEKSKKIEKPSVRSFLGGLQRSSCQMGWIQRPVFAARRISQQSGF